MCMTEMIKRDSRVMLKERNLQSLSNFTRMGKFQLRCEQTWDFEEMHMHSTSHGIIVNMFSLTL